MKMDFWTSYMIYLAVIGLIGGLVGFYFARQERKRAHPEKQTFSTKVSPTH